MENISLKLEKNFVASIKRAMKAHNYSTKTEFIRAALREKMAILEEQEILNDPDMMAQLRASARNRKKGKMWKLEY